MENHQKKYADLLGFKLICFQGQHDKIDIDLKDREVMVELSEGEEVTQKILNAIYRVFTAYEDRDLAGLCWEVFKRGIAIEGDEVSFILKDIDTNTVAAPTESVVSLVDIADWIEDIPCKYTDEEAESLLAKCKFKTPFFTKLFELRTAMKIRELDKRGLAIDPDGESFVISAVNIEPPDDIIHYKPTYEEAYAWALQMPCIMSDEIACQEKKVKHGEISKGKGRKV
jgi:hypothetical protein